MTDSPADPMQRPDAGADAAPPPASAAGKVPRESENIMLLAQDLATSRLSWSSRPTEVEFGFNNQCNLRCIMCHQADGIPLETMPLQDSRDSLEQILPWALHLTPSDASEPLMNDLDEVERLCRKHDVQLLMFCNATLLDPKTFEKIAPITHKIWFSIDSPEKETFEQLRAGSNFEEVIANIEYALPRCKEALIDVGFNAVVMEPNWHQMPELVDFVADLGGDQMALQELLPNSTGYDELKIEGNVSDEAYGVVVDAVRERAQARGVSIQLNLHQPFGGEIIATPPKQSSKDPIADIRDMHMDSLHRMHPAFCPMAMNYVKITPSGKVYPCCRGPEELEMGNVREESFDAIWNGERYRNFRKAMFSGKYPKVCADCVVMTGPAHFPGNKTSD